MRWSVVVVLLWVASAAAQESMLQAEFRREGERASDACKDFSFKTVPGCAYEVFTDHPLHIAAEACRRRTGLGWGSVRRRQEHQELAHDLGRGCGRLDEWLVAGGRIYEDDPHAE